MNSYEAGQSYALNGATEENCHFSYFNTEKDKDSWERGRDETYKLFPELKPND